MRKLVANFKIPAPMHLFEQEPPAALAQVTLDQLCTLAGIRNRVTGATVNVTIIAGKEHWTAPDVCCVGVGRAWKPSRSSALRVLEVLAHGFHDYAARECVCGKGLFVAPSSNRPGRQRIGEQAMTAGERMQRMRARRSASSAT